MQQIRGQDTKPELLIRRGLFARGWRFRLHVQGLPGRPDLVFPRSRAVIFVHGCFWHGHDCPRFVRPRTRAEFWAKKVAANQERDVRAGRALADAGWRRLVVWECALRGPGKRSLDATLDACEAFLRSAVRSEELSGAWDDGGPLR